MESGLCHGGKGGCMSTSAMSRCPSAMALSALFSPSTC
jgi:hypothetical protein